MEKLKQALKKARERLEYGYWFAGGYEDMEECVRLLEDGIAELEQPKTRQVSIGGNCVQSVIITGERSTSEADS